MKCPCKNDNSCCSCQLSVNRIIELQEKYWGQRDLLTNPNDLNEGRKMCTKELLNTGSYDEKLKIFKFSLYNNICEVGLLYILGFTSSHNVWRFPRQWSRLRSENLIEKGIKKDVSHKPVRSDNAIKTDHALAYIRYISATYGRDEEPGIGETVPDASVKTDNVRVLPYDNISHLHIEYEIHSKVNKEESRFIAKRETFRLAFNSLKNVRLLGAKGSFQTCDICNIANELLRKTSFTPEQRKIIMAYKRLHIDQQKTERGYMEIQRQKALEPAGYDGIPEYGFLMADGMTVYTNNTPVVGKTRKVKSSMTHQFTNRVVGVLAVCGPVNEKFLYNLDNFVSGGANTMIEIMRQGFFRISFIGIFITISSVKQQISTWLSD